MDSFHGGFLQTGNKGWLDSTSRIWAKETNSNVCAVDWSRLATYEYIITSQKHTRKVANHTSEFIKHLAKNGASIPQTTVAGHSLGAQISGFIGALLKGQLLAIYGIHTSLSFCFFWKILYSLLLIPISRPRSRWARIYVSIQLSGPQSAGWNWRKIRAMHSHRTRHPRLYLQMRSCRFLSEWWIPTARLHRRYLQSSSCCSTVSIKYE